MTEYIENKQKEENKEMTEYIENKQKEENKDIFETWIESYTAISKMWEESYLKLYKPWLESTGELLEKAIDAATINSQEKYKEFYEEWIKTQGRGQIGKITSAESNKEILEKLLTGAEKSSNIYKSWIKELDENSKKTREALEGDLDRSKYKEIYDLWIIAYAKIFDELLTLPIRDNIKEMFENYTGIPDIYSDTFIKISKLWNESYSQHYRPWIESIINLSEKSEEISKGKTGPDTYKEFYSLWINVYQQTYGKLFDIKSANSSKKVFDNFAKSTNIYTDLYKSWITLLDKLSQKSKELSKQSYNQETYKETRNLWIKVYQRTVDNFFDNIVISPFKELFAPLKIASNIYIDTLAKVSDMWKQSYARVQ